MSSFGQMVNQVLIYNVSKSKNELFEILRKT